MDQCKQDHVADDSDILMKIYQQYDEFIQSVIRFSARNAEDREDIYQEVFIALSVKSDLDGIRDVKGYLFRLVVNKANEFLRRKISRELRFKEYVQKQIDKTENQSEQELFSVEQMDKAVEMIREYLSEKESEAVLLRFKYHYGNEQAAQKMNVKKETLIRYVSVGLKKLRHIVKGSANADKERRGTL